jgi:hypothetical protein
MSSSRRVQRAIAAYVLEWPIPKSNFEPKVPYLGLRPAGHRRTHGGIRRNTKGTGGQRDTTRAGGRDTKRTGGNNGGIGASCKAARTQQCSHGPWRYYRSAPPPSPTSLFEKLFRPGSTYSIYRAPLYGDLLSCFLGGLISFNGH